MIKIKLLIAFLFLFSNYTYAQSDSFNINDIKFYYSDKWQILSKKIDKNDSNLKVETKIKNNFVIIKASYKETKFYYKGNISYFMDNDSICVYIYKKVKDRKKVSVNKNIHFYNSYLNTPLKKEKGISHSIDFFKNNNILE